MKNNSEWISLLLDNSGFIVINKALIKIIGIDAAIIIGELISEYNYYEKTGTLTNKEWFFSTQENITENTGLTRHTQDESIKKLIKEKIIETKIMGMPSKKYYKIIFKNLEKILKIGKKSLKLKVVKNDKQGCQKQQARLLKTTNKVVENDKQGCQKQQARLLKTATNNNNNKNKNNNNKTNLILSREDEIRKDAFQNFKKNINLNALKDYIKNKPLTNELLEDILKIIKELYDLKDNQYITISGRKYYGIDIKKILNSYNYDTIEYILYSIENNSSDIKNIKKYTIATLINAPKTINLYYTTKVNNDFTKPSLAINTQKINFS